MILLDTHVLIWMNFADRRLGPKAKALIQEYWERGTVAVSAITFWEVGQLVERRRVHPGPPIPQWRQQLLDSGLVELPLDGTIALRSLDLDGLPQDPADRFIAATAIVRDMTLVTADEKILAWRHMLVRQDAGR